jgi:choice-of-anchor C domain-containing protein
MKPLAVAIVLALAPSAFAELVTNGSFETGPSVPSSGAVQLNSVDNTSINGWTLSSGNIEYIGGATPYWVAGDGSASLDLNGVSSQGTIQQTLTTEVGQQYTLLFLATANPDAGAGTTKTLNYAIGAGGGDASGSFNITVSNTQSLSSMEWTTYTVIFYASSTSTLLSFSGDSDASSYGPVIDAVSVLETPEPAAFLMFGAGLGGLGLWRLSRKKAKRPAKA